MKAKGAAIVGLLLALVISFFQPLAHRFSAYLCCLSNPGSASSWLVLHETAGRVLCQLEMHFQYVVIDSIGAASFYYLIAQAFKEIS